MLETENPREQNGRDAFERFKAQARSAAIASLSILEESDIDRVYCDLHDDFVVRMNSGSGISYLFFQVKTKDKQNYNWSVADLFGLKKPTKKKPEQSLEEIKNSFVGKMLLHTISFSKHCNSVTFQTNINVHDDVEEIIKDIQKGSFSNKYSKELINNFNKIFSDKILIKFTDDTIKECLSKINLETDVQYLKIGKDNFEPTARSKIYNFSEIDLEYAETKEIILKLLALVEKKSKGVIKEISSENIEEYAGISIDDLLSVLSLSKEAYLSLKSGGDEKAIKSVSIIQRSLKKSGADESQIKYCSKCKVDWDIWMRTNRHVISDFNLNSLISRIQAVLLNAQTNGVISVASIRKPIITLKAELKDEGLLYDLNEDLLLGGFFSELVKRKS